MSRYIDADKLKEKIEEIEWWNDSTGFYDHIDIVHAYDIDDTPTADVVEVVRCKDCKHLTVVNNESAYARCEKTGYIFWSFRTDTREHFCAYGERREQNEG